VLFRGDISIGQTAEAVRGRGTSKAGPRQATRL
jgi:hypothetical protein